MFNHVPINPLHVLFGINHSVAEFTNARMAPVSGRVVESVSLRPVIRWTPPPPPFSKVNVDASWSRLNRLGFAVVVVRDAAGLFVAAARYAISASCVAVAEAMALLRGCELAASLGLISVIFESDSLESDSLESISCLSKSLQFGNWEAFPILANVVELGAAF